MKAWKRGDPPPVTLNHEMLRRMPAPGNAVDCTGCAYSMQVLTQAGKPTACRCLLQEFGRWAETGDSTSCQDDLAGDPKNFIFIERGDEAQAAYAALILETSNGGTS